jgi:hypothetical protein
MIGDTARPFERLADGAANGGGDGFVEVDLEVVFVEFDGVEFLEVGVEGIDEGFHVGDVLEHQLVIQISQVSECLSMVCDDIHQSPYNSSQVLDFPLFRIDNLHLLELVSFTLIQEVAETLTLTYCLLGKSLLPSDLALLTSYLK